MKTDVSVELTDEERNILKRVIDGKPSKKMLSRVEVRELVKDFFEGMLAAAAETPAARPAVEGKPTAEILSIYSHPWYQVAPEDEQALKGKSPGFIYGYNKVKYTARR